MGFAGTCSMGLDTGGTLGLGAKSIAMYSNRASLETCARMEAYGASRTA